MQLQVDIYRQACIIIHEIVKKRVFFNDSQRPRVFGLVTSQIMKIFKYFCLVELTMPQGFQKCITLWGYD